jgi:RsiW-degrading membrane proteinase PrsW (M82 family)
MAEIAVWGLFYYWQGCFPDAGSALYFSGVTYTTVGYGDLALPEPWRMLAPSEALIGILMAGLSTGLFFAVIHRLLEPYFKEKPPSEPSDSPEIHV